MSITSGVTSGVFSGKNTPVCIIKCFSDPSCDFESSNLKLCKWEQSTSDEFDWRRRSGRTGSYGTGPSSGHGGQGELTIPCLQ